MCWYHQAEKAAEAHYEYDHVSSVEVEGVEGVEAEGSWRKLRPTTNMILYHPLKSKELKLKEQIDPCADITKLKER